MVTTHIHAKILKTTVSVSANKIVVYSVIDAINCCTGLYWLDTSISDSEKAAIRYQVVTELKERGIVSLRTPLLHISKIPNPCLIED